MAWKQTEVRILGNSKTRSGSISRRLLFIWFMIASSILYIIPQNASNKLQLAFAYVFRLPLGMGDSFSLSVSTQQRYDNVVPIEKYIQLENKYANLDEMLKEQRRQFQTLYGLYNTYIGQDVNFILGNVILRSRNKLTIKCKGTYGLAEGQFVFDLDNSIIGIITNVLPQTKTATVKLVTASDSQIAVKIDGLKKDLLMQGNGNNTAKIGSVSREEKNQTGQKVFVINQSEFPDSPTVKDSAIKQSEFLDSPLIVGTVSECKPDDKQPLLWDITIKPSWDIEQLDEVAVIVTNPPK